MRPTSGRQAFAFLSCLTLFAAPAWPDDTLAGAAPDYMAPDDAAPTAESADAGTAPDPLFDEDPPEDYATELGASVPDPIERLNRQFFRFNDTLDQYLLVPVTNAYQYVIPSPVRMCIRRVFRNLKSPVYIVNNLLQLRFRDAAETFGGFVLNSTAGWAGLFDPGSDVGWEQHPADFGQTLGMFGVPSGPYLVVPLLGPSTLRDGAGDIVDRAFDPLTYLFGMGDLLFIGGSSGFVTREENAQALGALRGSSVDYYAAMRSAFTQNRESRIAELRARFRCTQKKQETAAAQ
jgi:phospholipid-binding lipoprotein MlaA